VASTSASLVDTCVAVAWPNVVAWTFVLVAAWWTTGSPRRRAWGIVLGFSAGAAAWLVPEDLYLVRGVSAMAAFVGGMRVVDLRRGTWTARGRLAHVVSVVDTRRLVRIAPRVDGKEISVGLAWTATELLGYRLLIAPAPTSALAFWGWRWGSGLILAYAGVAAGYAFARAAYAAVGFETGPLHVSPVLSRSVVELWGERWARPISLWLGQTFFRPWARRRRPLQGALLAFGVSAAFHANAVWVALGLVRGLTMAAAMLAYFLAQGVIVALERALGTKRWAPWAGHLWTIMWMLATAPLFLEPSVRVLGLPPASPW
jgi:hypothetical protein